MSRQLTPAQARRALLSLTGRSRDRAIEVINETAEEVTKIAQSKALVRTGRLKAAIDSRKANKRQKKIAAASGVRVKKGGVTTGELFEGDPNNPFYWKYHEYGTSRHGATPMFRPAAQTVEPLHESSMRRMLKRAAEDMARQA